MSEHETVAAPITPSFTSSSTFGLGTSVGSQRRTSNFFPASGGPFAASASDLDFKLPSSLHYDSHDSTPEAFPFTKRHNSSPMIGAYNGKPGAHASSRFFNSNESSPYFTTPTPSLSTPVYQKPSSRGSFSEATAIDLTHDLQALGLSDTPSRSSSYPYAKPTSAGSAITAPSPPSSTTPMINLASSTTTSGSATPSLVPTSIWNDNSIPSIGSLYGKNIKLGTLTELIEHDVSYNFGTSSNTFTGLSKDFSFEDEFAPSGQFDDEISPILMSTKLDLDEGLSKSKKNIFSGTVNNPSFVPAAKLKPAPFMKERKAQDNGLERMREFINTHKKRPGSVEGPHSKIALKIQTSNNSKMKQSDRSKLLMSEKRSPLEKPHHDDRTLDRSKIKIRLPKLQGPSRASGDEFTRDILTSRNFTSKYAEDYCSTFYKRNSHGYMFIREPTNSLKVNSSGGKSWVELKIKFRGDELAQQTEQRQQVVLLLRKLRVDIKKLPIWKPINLNGSGPVKHSSGTPKKLNGGFSSGSGHKKRGTGSSKEAKKHKNLNVSKRFGKKV